MLQSVQAVQSFSFIFIAPGSAGGNSIVVPDQGSAIFSGFSCNGSEALITDCENVDITQNECYSTLFIMCTS